VGCGGRKFWWGGGGGGRKGGRDSGNILSLCIDIFYSALALLFLMVYVLLFVNIIVVDFLF
jgi:hypothetical protein